MWTNTCWFLGFSKLIYWKRMRLLDRFKIWKRHLITRSINFPDILRSFVWRSLMTSQVRSKVIFVTISHRWLGWAEQRYQVEIKPMKRRGSPPVIHLSTLLSVWWPRVKSCSSDVTRPKKVKMWILCLDGVIHVFRADFRKEREKWH